MWKFRSEFFFYTIFDELDNSKPFELYLFFRQNGEKHWQHCQAEKSRQHLLDQMIRANMDHFKSLITKQFFFRFSTNFNDFQSKFL